MLVQFEVAPLERVDLAFRSVHVAGLHAADVMFDGQPREALRKLREREFLHPSSSNGPTYTEQVQGWLMMPTTAMVPSSRNIMKKAYRCIRSQSLASPASNPGTKCQLY